MRKSDVKWSQIKGLVDARWLQLPNISAMEVIGIGTMKTCKIRHHLSKIHHFEYKVHHNLCQIHHFEYKIHHYLCQIHHYSDTQNVADADTNVRSSATVKRFAISQKQTQTNKPNTSSQVSHAPGRAQEWANNRGR